MTKSRQKASDGGLADQAAEKAGLNADQLRTIVECVCHMYSETVDLSASKIARQLTGRQSIPEIERIMARELRSAARRVNRVINAGFRSEPPGAN